MCAPCDRWGVTHGRTEPYSAAWWRRVRKHHLAAHPDLDRRSRDNLDDIVRWAEEKSGRL